MAGEVETTMTEHHRLGTSTSPYLIAHADNPVDWWPWCDEAIEEARRRDCPIFLSIGYSTCYWCHVMERESFKDAEIASILNERFVCIKVDREERPDLDDVYMAATVVSTGQGGWPMTVFLEPTQLRPFFCGTYFPPRPSPRTGSHPTIKQLAEGIERAWRDDRARVVESASALAAAVTEELGNRSEPSALTPALVESSVQALLHSFDSADGGFGGAPKFPQPTNLAFLLDVRPRVQNEDARHAIDAAVRTTLDRMAIGGLFDHVGGGFHRYSVDRHWRVPHFEKMLYDNAQLLGLYARASVAYASEEYALVAERIASYVEREMTSEEGLFFSAQDAEVDGREGLNYVWTADEVSETLRPLGDAAVDRVLGWYGLKQGPNFRDPHHPEADPVNVLYLQALPGELASCASMDRVGVLDLLDRANRLLLSARDTRRQPNLDDKIIAAWNGLMVEALADASLVMHRPEYLARAERSLDMLLRTHLADDGTLLRISRDGVAHTPAFLEDYAMVLGGLIAVVRAQRAAGQESEAYMGRAVVLAEQAIERCGDGQGGFFDTPDGHTLFVRPRSSHDGAMPSGQSGMLSALASLYEVTGDGRWLGASVDAARALSSRVARQPVSSLHAMRTLLKLFDDEQTRTILGGIGPVAASAGPVITEGDEDFTPVEVYADRDEITVSSDQPGGLWLELRIAPGFHIIAADPGESAVASELVPLRVSVLEGAGVRVYGDYPAGQSWGDDGLLVHSESVRFAVVVERDERQVKDRIVLGVHFQACDQQSCRLATTVELDVAVDVV